LAAFEKYADQAEITSTMLADCTAEPMPFAVRMKIAIQETAENTAHSVYLAQKVLLHEAARPEWVVPSRDDEHPFDVAGV
jgi:hypothetical protein